MLNRLIKRLQQLTAKLNNFIKWGLSKSILIGVILKIARVESQIDEIDEPKMPEYRDCVHFAFCHIVGEYVGMDEVEKKSTQANPFMPCQSSYTVRGIEISEKAIVEASKLYVPNKGTLSQGTDGFWL